MDKKITLKELEHIAREVGLPNYPQYIGNGLYKLSDNCITGRRGYELFMDELRKSQHTQNSLEHEIL